VIAGIVVILVIAVVVAISFQSSNNQQATAEEDQQNRPEEPDVIPTVDSSVDVELEGIDNNTTVVVSVSNAPEGTEEVEVSITYDREEAGLDQPVQDGSFQTLEIDDGEGEVEMFLGTESSGNKRFHELTDGEIRVEMKFIGDYGEQIYQNDFQLEL
jgi:hypothetical protein